MKAYMLRISVVTLFAIALTVTVASAQKKYDPGATDTEIKIGSIMPYTGVFSEYGANGRAEAAYFHMINDLGGINGRKINFLSVDNGSEVKKTIELAHRLVERDEVLLFFGNWGLPYNKAIRTYLNERQVPQLFIASNDSTFDDPSHFPWTMGFTATKRTEGSAYAKYILRSKPDAKIVVLYPNDEGGREYLLGVNEGLGEKASTMITKEVPFEYSNPATIDSQVEALKRLDANVFINLTMGRFATQAIRKAYDIGWSPMQFIPNGSLSIAAFLEPAGLEKATGIISNARSKGWSAVQARQDPAVREFLEWMRKYNSTASERDANNVYGYESAQTLVEVLKKCGDDLTRANVLKQATSLNLELGMLRPGIRVTTSPTDYRPIKQLYLIKFNGKDWVSLGEVIGG